jgi:hypothetical protein
MKAAKHILNNQNEEQKMRLTPNELHAITGRTVPAAQARWFERHYGQTNPHDTKGVIITAQAWEAMVARKCGTSAKGGALDVVNGERPEVKMVKALTQ